MKNTSQFICLSLLMLLLVNSNTSAQNDSQKYTFKQGVIATHWADHIFSMPYANPDFFNPKDVKWIAEQGLDHIQIRLSGSLIANEENVINSERLSALESAITWAQKEKLGVIINLMNFPEFKVDTTLSQSVQDEINLKKQAEFWNKLSKYFSKYGTVLGFVLHGRITDLTNKATYLNTYNARMLKEIRKSNPTRKVYIATLGIDKLKGLNIPNDEFIGLSTDYRGAEFVFAFQHSANHFPKNFPLISFPTTLPDLSNLVEKNHIALKYTKLKLNEDYFSKTFSLARSHINLLKKNIDIYIPFWGYYVDSPVDPQAVKDKKSIHNFAKAFDNATKRQNIGWAIYDIKTGMAIQNEDRTPTPLLEGLNLKTNR